MKTKILIFKESKGVFHGLEFVKEGDFFDAMSYFDDRYPVFYQDKNSDDYNGRVYE